MKTLKELLADFRKDKPKAKYVIKASGKLKSDVTITDQAGVGYVIAGDAVNDISQAQSAPIFLANPDGTVSTTQAPDGDITLADGTIVSVSGGVVSNVKPVAAPATNAQLAQQVAALQKDNSEMLEVLAELVEANKTLKGQGTLSAAEIEAKLDAKVLALKKEIGSNHTPQRTKAERNKAQKDALQKLSPLQLKMRYPKGIPAEIQKVLDEE